MSKFYIATTLTNAAQHNEIRDRLVALGQEITYDWTAHGGVWQDGIERVREVAQLEAQGVADADFVCVILPGGRGTHTELGMAIAAGKPVLIYGRDEDFAGPTSCAFYHHPLVRRVWHWQSWEQLALGTAARLAEFGHCGDTRFDLVAHLYRQREFSERTFGPGMRTAGVCDHIRKELREIEANPDDLSEWVDVILLGLDGAWRTGHCPVDIGRAIAAKQAKNEARTWPDWRTAEPGKAIEHVRSKRGAA